MNIDIHGIINKFKVGNVDRWMRRVNHFNGSVWYSSGTLNDEMLHVRISSEYQILRFYTVSNGNDVKISYELPKDEIRVEILSKDNEKVITPVLVTDASTITSTEMFFQRSLIDDMGGIEYDDVCDILAFYDTMVVLAKDVLGDNI